MNTDACASRSEMRRLESQLIGKLERELSASAAEIERLRARVKRLEEALAALFVNGHLWSCFQGNTTNPDNDLCAPHCKKARSALED